MKKTLITLSGSSQTGKTTTLNELANKIIIKYNINKKDVEYSNKEANDKTIIISNVGKRGLVIGIHTAGDNGELAKKSLELLKKCDIVICPTRSFMRGKTGSMAVVQKYLKEHKDEILYIPLFKMFQFGQEDEYSINDELVVDNIMYQLNILI